MNWRKFFSRPGGGPATKQDLLDAEKRIIAAFGERLDPNQLEELDEAVGLLEKAVDANIPKTEMKGKT